MSSARHHFTSGTLTDDQLRQDITTDITTARGAQRDLTAVGQHRTADLMGAAVDDGLDELAALNNGTWRPRHA